MATNFLFCMCAVACMVIAEKDPQVQIKNGQLIGKYMNTKQERKFAAFLGVPYAKPPVGDLRFKDPIPADPWTEPKLVQKDANVCPQRNVFVRSSDVEGNEDCLYLNVYTPQLPNTENKQLPVMVFFHGGGWICGAGTTFWYSPEFLLDKDVVLVIPNYRLGPLGFISTQDDVVPGNMGMKDQTLVLKWIKENIAEFGGNPNLVTGFGESAGGASVQYHMLSPLSKGLIQRGISQSGTALNVWAAAQPDEPLENTKKLAESVNCPTDSSEEMVKCLRKVDAYELIYKDDLLTKWDLDPMIPFKPMVEHDHPGAFLSKKPIDIILDGEMENIPWVTGITSGEGALRVAGICGNPKILEELINDFDRIIPISLMYDRTAPDPDLVTRRIKEYYFKNGPISADNRHNLVDLFTDGWFMSALDESIRLHIAHSTAPVYVYYFNHRGQSSFSEVFGDRSGDYGVCHADELQYLFPVGDTLFPDVERNDEHRKVAEIMINLWVNFAITGNPTPYPEDWDPIKWDPVRSEDVEYLHIGNSTNIFMDKELLAERAHFWTFLPTRQDKHDFINSLKDEL